MKLFDQYIKKINSAVINIKMTRKIKKALGEAYGFKEFCLDIKMVFKSNNKHESSFNIPLCDEHDIDIWFENNRFYGECKKCKEIFILNSAPIEEIVEKYALKNMEYKIKKAINILESND